MNLPRPTIAGLMAVVLVVAINIAAARALVLFDDELILVIAPIGIAVQIGLLRSFLGRGRHRAFWSGFVAAGTLMVASFLWALIEEDSWCSNAWANYIDLIRPIMLFLCERFFWDIHGKTSQIILFPTMVFFLQLLISSVCGLLASSIIRRRLDALADEFPTAICSGIRP